MLAIPKKSISWPLLKAKGQDTFTSPASTTQAGASDGSSRRQSPRLRSAASPPGSVPAHGPADLALGGPATPRLMAGAAAPPGDQAGPLALPVETAYSWVRAGQSRCRARAVRCGVELVLTTPVVHVVQHLCDIRTVPCFHLAFVPEVFALSGHVMTPGAGDRAACSGSRTLLSSPQLPLALGRALRSEGPICSDSWNLASTPNKAQTKCCWI